jgi:hypothetical protein
MKIYSIITMAALFSFAALASEAQLQGPYEQMKIPVSSLQSMLKMKLQERNSDKDIKTVSIEKVEKLKITSIILSNIPFYGEDLKLYKMNLKISSSNEVTTFHCKAALYDTTRNSSNYEQEYYPPIRVSECKDKSGSANLADIYLTVSDVESLIAKKNF